MKNAARALFLAACVSANAAFADQGVDETALEAPGATGPLKGSLVSPRSAIQAVVLVVPGSGPTDRDGNSPRGVTASTYRLLAQGLAARGVATLRFDKRGLFGSVQATKDPNAVTIADYVDDVRAWISVLKARTHVPCVWVLGHSEGGLVALASARSVPDECGLVLAATPAQPMGELLRGQLEANPANAPLLGQALPAIDALEKGRKVDTAAMHPALQALFNPAVQGFLISAFSYDPRRLIAAVDKPVLVIQGERDIQVPASNGPELKQADPAARLVMLADTNHVLKAVAIDDPRANLATYGDPVLPLAPGVVDAIADFLIANRSSANR